MGLDMYAITTTRQLTAEIDFPREDGDHQFHYWRKHPNLHGWMENLYHMKGGVNEFNCTTVQLTSEDIDLLECAIKEGKLPETCGFFFGKSDGSECEDDLDFISNAHGALEQGLTVYYSSWW